MASLSDVTLDRGLPASVEAERSILGAILLDNHSYNEAAEKLRAEDFSLDPHRRIYSRMSELVDARRAVDIVTLAEELARRKEVEAVGGVAYLASLTEGLPRRPSSRSASAIPPSPAPPTKAKRHWWSSTRPSRGCWKFPSAASLAASPAS